MRIFSKFTDYYDGSQRFGFDETCLYQRTMRDDLTKSEIDQVKKVLTDIDFQNLDLHTRYYSGETSFNFDDFVILFCGKLYRGITTQRLSYGLETSLQKFFCYNEKQVESFLRKSVPAKEFDRYLTGKTNLRIRTLAFTRNGIDIFFEKNGQEFQQIIDLQQELKIPVIMFKGDYWRTPKVIYNPILRELEFNKLVDSFQAFQELQMFISGVLGGRSPAMVEISDEIRAEKHGMDKTSFRNPPGTKKIRARQ